MTETDRLGLLLGNEEQWVHPPRIQMPEPSYVNSAPSKPMKISWESDSQNDEKIVTTNPPKSKEQVLLEGSAHCNSPSFQSI